MVPRLNEIQFIIDKAHIIEKCHVLWRVTADIILKKINYDWPNMHKECEEYVKQ